MSKVELYVYDLSNGLARTMSLSLTGKQLDGIWHTSIVYNSREIYYGQGILESRPGTTHHGRPLQVLSMGETAIDPETFDEFIDGLRDRFTAEKYHLLEHNCNTFTAELVQFLTGAEYPAWISSLPNDFLSTPFGQMLRPRIDTLFSPNRAAAAAASPFAQPAPVSSSSSIPRALPTPPTEQQPRNNALASSLLSSIASQATSTNDNSQQQHPHKLLPLPSIQVISPSPILYQTSPNYSALLSKLSELLATIPSPSSDTSEILPFLRIQLVPFLETKTFPSTTTLDTLLSTFLAHTSTLFSVLPTESLFPLLDLWRIACLHPQTSSYLSLLPPSAPFHLFPSLLHQLLLNSPPTLPKPLLLTSLRLLANAFASLPLAALLLSPTHPAPPPSSDTAAPASTPTSTPRQILTTVLVELLLAEDASVRSAAAGLAFNVVGFRHRRGAATATSGDEEEADWSLELGIAILESIKMETKSEDVLHRLLSALALLLYLSPHVDSSLAPNLTVIGLPDILNDKSRTLATKPAVKGLIQEIGRLCAE